ncbi:hypothetical protein BDZ89DRAFT_1163561 [Hymenopellis radicata]|nr:hypothetical protein BDZ89DRAFT_1163561 [Hymenopellis radicata]
MSSSSVLSPSPSPPPTIQTIKKCQYCRNIMPSTTVTKGCRACLDKRSSYKKKNIEKKQEASRVENRVLQEKIVAARKLRTLKELVKGGRKMAKKPPPPSNITCLSDKDFYTSITAYNATITQSFSVVFDPEINNQQRTRLVSKRLAKEAKLKFDYHENIFTGKNTSNTHTRVFRCTCKDNLPQIHSAPKLERKPSDLSGWIKKKGKNLENDDGRCAGRIAVIAEKDTSHVLGIEGQRIIVKVDH